MQVVSFINIWILTCGQVLMNLTNENPIGCQQIAACGGLETMSLLIVSHFPSFSSSLFPFSDGLESDHKDDIHLTDQELDFLVAILGLLVNLVEKDGHNRLIFLLNIYPVIAHVHCMKLLADDTLNYWSDFVYNKSMRFYWQLR